MAEMTSATKPEPTLSEPARSFLARQEFGLLIDGESGPARRELAQAALLIGNAALAEENLALLRAREEDDELLLLSARARRLLGDPPGALALLQRIRPGRGGVSAAQLKAELASVQQR